jgi:ATP-dependent DNA helicase DinG
LIATPDKNKPLDLRHILGPDGPLAESLGEYESRPQQIEMALAVQEALKGSCHLAVEAGTGVGKSFAYLIAAIDHARQTKKKVVISTYTITLQQQLINKDIPFLLEVLPVPFRACLAKGRNNYLCRRRLEYALRNPRSLFDDHADEIRRIADWARTTEDGSLSDLPFVPSSQAWDAVMSEHGNCRGRKCSEFGDCFYWKSRRLLKTADLIIANHALLCSDLVLRQNDAGILPDYAAVILDEAHNIEHVAEDHFGIDISNFSFTHLLGRLYNRRTRKGLLANIDSADARPAVAQLEQASKAFFAQVQAWYAHAEKESNGRCPPGFAEDNLTEPVREMRLSLTRLQKSLPDEDDQLEFTRYIDRLHEMENQLKDFLTQPETGHVYWVEVTGQAGRRVALRSAPVNVAPLLKKTLFDEVGSVICTSATLSAGGNTKEAFAFFAGRVGLESFKAVQLGSPFDYRSQVTLYLEAALPNPESNEYEPAAAAAIEKYLRLTDGHAFVLFTSYAMLGRIAEKLGPFFAEQKIDLLCQGQGIDRAVLLDRFKSDLRSVLFGTDSFWQGVDVPGDALTNVIIVRLPFAVPSHPLIQGKIEFLRQSGENPFSTFQLPTAVIKFKQGFGRLIRKKTARGMVVVLDSRIVNRPYGRLFLDAIPECTVRIVR